MIGEAHSHLAEYKHRRKNLCRTAGQATSIDSGARRAVINRWMSGLSASMSLYIPIIRVIRRENDVLDLTASCAT